MGMRQLLVVCICVLINAIDGFDILAISLASPGVAAEWNVGQASLGIMLSAELVGMGLGSIILGQLADRVGRRPVLLGCLVLMTTGMFGAATAPNFLFLATVRLFTGIGIGGMLPCLSAIVAEVVNQRWRAPAVAMMAAGYPAGAVLGGATATFMLVDGDWRDVFRLGALLSAAVLPVALVLLPEPLGHAMRHPSSAKRLAAVNRTLRMLGRPAASIVSEPEDRAKPHVADLFRKGTLAATMMLTSAYFLHMITFYFFLKWIPKMIADLGFSAVQGGSVLVWANVGGLIGSVLFSVLTWRISTGRILIVTLGGTFVFLALFGLSGTDLQLIYWCAAAAGMFTNASVVGLYALIAQIYPEQLRAGGAGFTLGLGRVGAVLGPVAGGVLFEMGFEIGVVAIIMGLGSLGAVFVIAQLLRLKRQQASL